MTTTDTETPAAEEPAATPPALEAGDAEVPFWQRPYVERYLVPFVLPIAVVVTVVVFAINISRIFLSGHGSVSVIVGSLITVAILAGATMLSAAPRMRTSSLALITGAFVFSVVMGGWLSLGTAEPEEEDTTTLAVDGPASMELDFVSGNLFFDPSRAEAETGIVRINLANEAGQHTFVFDTGGTNFAGLSVAAADESDTGRAFFGEPGEYVFYCSVQGHREAGMEGTITVSGEPTTLEAVQAELGDAGSEGGEPAAEEPPPVE